MNDFPWLLVLAVGAILLLATRQYRRQRQREAQNDAAPLRIVAAEVKHKREFPRSRRVRVSIRGWPSRTCFMRPRSGR